MTAPPEIAQVRLEGAVPTSAGLALEALTAGEPLPQLWVDLRDWEGRRVLKLPGRVVQLHYAEGDEPPTLEVEIAAVLLTDEARAGEVSTAPLAEIIAARRTGNGKPARLPRAEIERRDQYIRALRAHGCSIQVIATVYGLSQRRVREITRRV